METGQEPRHKATWFLAYFRLHERIAGMKPLFVCAGASIILAPALCPKICGYARYLPRISMSRKPYLLGRAGAKVGTPVGGGGPPQLSVLWHGATTCDAIAESQVGLFGFLWSPTGLPESGVVL